jgi:predicted amidohydrolase
MSIDQSESLSVAAIQMNSQPDPAANLNVVEALVQQAAEQDAQVVMLPENFIHYGNEGQKWRQVETIQDLVEEELPKLAKKWGIWLMGGGYPVVSDQASDRGYPKIYNRATFWDPSGKRKAHYDKIHLFDVHVEGDQQYQESRYVEPGSAEAVTFALNKHFTLGFSICYDLRFPELYRKLTEGGANVLCVPAAFTAVTGQAHWKPLLRARAIENTSYVVAPALYGTHGKRMQTYGHAMIIDPWGEVVAEGSCDQDQVLVHTLKLAKLEKVRSELPSLDHRKIR